MINNLRKIWLFRNIVVSLPAMKKEFGKWLMDIAKYMVTALLLSTIFADMAEPIILWMVVIFSAVTLIAGLSIIYNSENEVVNNKKKGKK